MHIRRLIALLAGLLALLLGGLSALPAPAAEVAGDGYAIKGRVLDTFLAAGGGSFTAAEAKIGTPVGTETRLTFSDGRRVYHQHTVKGDARGGIIWSSAQGGTTWLSPGIPSLSGVASERDALARYGFDPGEAFRSARLCDATLAAKQRVASLLHGGLIIDLRTSGPVKSCPDPQLPGVTRVNVPVPSHADYARYVNATERAAFGAALTAAAGVPGDAPIWVHCSAGRDRTGWFYVWLMLILGAEPAQAQAEYLKTSGASLTKYKAGMAAVRAKYGAGSATEGRWEYITRTDGLNLRAATIAALRAKFGA